MEKKVNKILLIIMIICGTLALLLRIRIAINKSFIKNYPNTSQEYKLVLLSMFNYYEPYIAWYNYGDYYYKEELYEEAANKFKKALEYKIPKNRICEVEINLSLALIKQSNGERKRSRVKELLEEANSHLKRCININIEIPEDEDDDYPINDDDSAIGRGSDPQNPSKDYEEDDNPLSEGNGNDNSNKDGNGQSGGTDTNFGSGNTPGNKGNKDGTSSGAGAGDGDGNSVGPGDGSGTGDGNGVGDKGEGSGSGTGDGTGKADASSSTDGKGNVSGNGGNSSGSGTGFGNGDGEQSGKGSGSTSTTGYVGRSIAEQQGEAQDISDKVTKTLDELFNDHLDEINGNMLTDAEWEQLLQSNSDAIGRAEMAASEKKSVEAPEDSSGGSYSEPPPVSGGEAPVKTPKPYKPPSKGSSYSGAVSPGTGYGDNDPPTNSNPPNEPKESSLGK